MSFLSRLFPQPRISLEEQLELLAECGVHLRPGFSVDTLLESFDREKYEERPFIGAVIRLGGELEREPFTSLSDNLFHLDTECIERTGDYAAIAQRMRDLAQGELPIENIRDHIDIENGDAWLAFELRGETTEWHARVKDAWIDPEILSNFCGLLTAQRATRRYTYLDLKGHDCLIGCATEEELRRLRKLTHMNFTWLE
jgi:hypothetical protein